MKQDDLENAEAICRVLSCILYNTPTSEFYSQLKSDVLLEWPTLISTVDDTVNIMHSSINNTSTDNLIRDYYQLFIGPGTKSAYPWGSVYTDKDHLLYGQTCVDFENFCKHNKIKIATDKKQPSDHIGIIIGVMGYLLKEQNTALTSELISKHLQPWLPVFLESLAKNAQTDFYKNVPILISSLINDLRKLLPN